jgi:hypothetical protein
MCWTLTGISLELNPIGRHHVILPGKQTIMEEKNLALMDLFPGCGEIDLMEALASTRLVTQLGSETMTEELTITGVYVAHWEAGRFVVETGRRFFGLLPRVEKWQPIFPPGFRLPKSENPRGPAKYFKMTVRGTLGPKGHFAHLGICTRQLTISEVVSCEETHRPGKTW